MGEEMEHEGWLLNATANQSWPPFPNLSATAEEAMKSAAEKVAPAPPSPAAKGKKRIGGETEDHIWTERERRRKMRNMFSTLHALLPNVPEKTDKASIVYGAEMYIRHLKQTLEELEQRKRDTTQSRQAFIADQGTAPPLPDPNPAFQYPPVFNTYTSPNVIINVCGRDAQMSLCGVRKPGLLSAVCFVMDKNNLEILSAHVSSDPAAGCIIMIHARANGQFMQAFPVEEIFKEAAAEIMTFFNS